MSDNPPGPEQAERNQAYVRAQVARRFPMWGQAVDAIVAADIPLETAARDLARLRVQLRRSRPRSRSAR
jgi:hypothetical protein